MSDNPDRARIIAPPPLLGVACIAAGFVARHFYPLPLFSTIGVVQVVPGIALMLLGATIIIWARQTFIAHGTHLNPYRPTVAVVVTGPYQFSRNPIYAAFLVIVVAFALCANSIWFVLAAVLLFFLLHFGVVKREERYLSGKFGAAYEEYCRRVRRWI